MEKDFIRIMEPVMVTLEKNFSMIRYPMKIMRKEFMLDTNGMKLQMQKGYWNQVENDHGKGYEGVVQYPFGYGLSYTTFDWELKDHSVEIAKDGSVSATVKVTNTGDKAGKDVVEFYYTAPYEKGGIEKSAVELGDYAKTKLLGPGESEEVVVTVSAEDMASYDAYDNNKNGFAGYELDEVPILFLSEQIPIL